jgi:hypothetical protein
MDEPASPATAAAASPVVDSNDTETGAKRIMIAPLLEEHKGLLEALRAECQTELNSASDDAEMHVHYNSDLFLLRFLLSAKFKLEKAVLAVKTTIAWRNKNKDMLKRMREGEPVPGMKECLKFNLADEHKTTLDGAPVVIVRSGVSDLTAAVKNIPREHIYNTFVFSKERVYMACDRLSREKGYIVKMISILDMAHDSIFRIDRQYFSIMGASMKELELCYPQLLGATVVMNAPKWVKMAINIGSKFVPATSIEKLVVCQHPVPSYEAQAKNVDISKNPYAWARFIAPENIPTFLGGTCKCHKTDKYPNGRCICGIDNDRQIQVTKAPLPEPLEA